MKIRPAPAPQHWSGVHDGQELFVTGKNYSLYRVTKMSEFSLALQFKNFLNCTFSFCLKSIRETNLNFKKTKILSPCIFLVQLLREFPDSGTCIKQSWASFLFSERQCHRVFSFYQCVRHLRGVISPFVARHHVAGGGDWN